MEVMMKKILSVCLFLVMASPAVAMNEERKRNKVALFRAVQEGDVQGLRQILDANLPRGEDHLALYLGDAPTAEIAQILIDHGADVNEQPQEDTSILYKMHMPPLRLLMMRPIEVAAVLLKNGANPNAADAYGITPLGYAVQANLDGDDKLKLLLSYGADPSIKGITRNGTILDDAQDVNPQVVPLLERQQKILGLLKENRADNLVDLMRSRPISGRIRVPRN
jgi:ankyrin repeat protein